MIKIHIKLKVFIIIGLDNDGFVLKKKSSKNKFLVHIY